MKTSLSARRQLDLEHTELGFETFENASSMSLLRIPIAGMYGVERRNEKIQAFPIISSQSDLAYIAYVIQLLSTHSKFNLPSIIHYYIIFRQP